MKTSTAILVGLGAVGAGFAFWYFKLRPSAGLTIAAGPTAQPSTLSPDVLNQPSQLYPAQPAPVTRQDTASQPWYGGARPADASASLIDPALLTNIQTAQALSTGVASLTDLWENMGVGSWFSDPADSGDDIFGSMNWSAYDA